MNTCKLVLRSLLPGLLLIWTSGCASIALPPPTAATSRLANVATTIPQQTLGRLTLTEQIALATQAAYAFVNLTPETIHESTRITETFKFDHSVLTTITESDVDGDWYQVQSISPNPSGTDEFHHLYKIDGVYYCQRGDEWQQGDSCVNPDGGALDFMALMLLGIMSGTAEIDAIKIQAVQSISQTEEAGSSFTVYHYTSQIKPYNTSGEVMLWMRQSDGRPVRAVMIGKLPVNSDQLQSVEIEWIIEYGPHITIKRPI